MSYALTFPKIDRVYVLAGVERRFVLDDATAERLAAAIGDGLMSSPVDCLATILWAGFFSDALQRGEPWSRELALQIVGPIQFVQLGSLFREVASAFSWVQFSCPVHVDEFN